MPEMPKRFRLVRAWISSLGIRQKILLVLAVLALFWAGTVTLIVHTYVMDKGIEVNMKKAASLAERSLQLFLVSTEKFHHDFQAAKDPVAKKEILDRWNEFIFAMDEAIITDFGPDKPHVQLTGGEKYYGFPSLGENTKVRTPFEKKAAEALMGGAEVFRQVDQDHASIAYAMRSSVNPGCAECHISTVEGIGAETNRDILLGSVNASVPLAASRRNAAIFSTVFIGGMVSSFLMLMGLLYLLLDRLMIRRMNECVDAIESLADQDYETRCSITSNDELGRMGKAINDTKTNVKAVYEDRVFFYESLLDAIPSPVIAINNEKIIIFLNKAAKNVSSSLKPGVSCRFIEANVCDTDACTVTLAQMESPKAEGNLVRFREQPDIEYSARAALMENRSGEHVGFVEVFHDVTRLRGMEHDLKRAKEAAEKANRAKSDFLAKMSHEIRTPMTAILGYAELLKTKELNHDEQNEALQAIRGNGKHLLTIINTILDLSRVELGRVLVEKKACDIRALLTEILSRLRVSAVEKGLALESRVDEGLPHAIHTDPVLLRQILTNLVGNSIKFSEVGQIEVHARREIDPGGKTILAIDVKDQGVGIPTEQLENIFMPFQQADDASNRKYHGTGLGLAISRRYAQLLEGDLFAVGRPDQGSIFTVHLPLETAVEKEAISPELREKTPADLTEELEKYAGARVLLAEDGLDNQRLVSHFLKKTVIQLEIVENGKLALYRVFEDPKAGPFDLILLDMQMPVLDGYAAASQLREGGFEGAIIAFTAHSMKHERQKCLQAGCNDYLTKPFSKKSLLECLLKHLERQEKRCHEDE